MAQPFTPFDREMMQRCLALARQALGRTAPNPMVGSVIVKDQHIVGEGFHSRMQVNPTPSIALRAAGDRARGATVYVSLEPCNHYGRTPPCSEALVEAQVKEVIVGMVDPDPRVAGGGIERLRAAGITVKVGLEEEQCRQLNEAFIHRITHQLPFGLLKYAMTLDGKIGTSHGHSRWISCPQSRIKVHELRGACDAVIVGGNTVRQDNPKLTTHGVVDHNPLRVVMSETLDLPLDAHLWPDPKHPSFAPTVNNPIPPSPPTLVFTGPQGNPAFKAHLEQRGLEVVTLECLTPLAVMEDLYHRGLSSVLWECGGNLSAAAISQGVIQKVIAFVAPKIIGGDQAPTPVGNLGSVNMDEALLLKNVYTYMIDRDIVIEGYL
ncbi:MAG: bifunctional diaminohydroxyphosphoribosylaminopyrimidine deaminase/5-amino-6-(5-phosphoribosylamino)uracil reductase RibD [Synechococcaceae cyanobacterium RL_1_2]|nr:bifunctional diaminohydroxyphosphoribosylaminopyrimidine deaminase/5-amino-6-(5-phosphoribosylamino)uracil reductase RibD [Synechococcaceae cyanobacterium RL_1_2]